MPDSEFHKFNLDWIMNARYGRCPQCRSRELVAGPWGGLSRNVFCSTCMIRWTFHAVSHGIVQVTNEGECSPDEIDFARQRYPSDQPWRPMRDWTLEDCHDYVQPLGAEIMRWFPEETGFILLAFNKDSDCVTVSNIKQDVHLELIDLLKKMEARLNRDSKT